MRSDLKDRTALSRIALGIIPLGGQEVPTDQLAGREAARKNEQMKVSLMAALRAVIMQCLSTPCLT